jgi:hypothetical protein
MRRMDDLSAFMMEESADSKQIHILYKGDRDTVVPSDLIG